MTQKEERFIQWFKVCLGVAALVILTQGFGALKPTLGGIAVDQPTFGAADITKTQVTCNTTTTLLLATSTGRLSFYAVNPGAATIYLCRGDTVCTATTTFRILYPSSTNNQWEQSDGYTGPYRCAGTASQAINITYSP